MPRACCVLPHVTLPARESLHKAACWGTITVGKHLCMCKAHCFQFSWGCFLCSTLSSPQYFSHYYKIICSKVKHTINSDWLICSSTFNGRHPWYPSCLWSCSVIITWQCSYDKGVSLVCSLKFRHLRFEMIMIMIIFEIKQYKWSNIINLGPYQWTTTVFPLPGLSSSRLHLVDPGFVHIHWVGVDA